MSEVQTTYRTKTQTIFRTVKNADNPFVMIDRRPLENPNLSWKAKGVLAYLLSRPDNWIVRFKDLVKRSPDGGHTVRASLKELKQAGHIKIVAERENGRVTQWTYTVYETPLPDDEIQQVEKQQVENRTFNNNKLTKSQQEEAQPNIFQVYESEIGIITPMISYALIDWEKAVPVTWIADAIREAVTNNARNWKYIEAILKRWKAQGNQESMKTLKDKKAGNVKTAPVDDDQWLKELSAKQARMQEEARVA